MDFNIFRSRKTAVHNQEQSSVHHVSNPVISSEIIVFVSESILLNKCLDYQI